VAVPTGLFLCPKLGFSGSVSSSSRIRKRITKIYDDVRNLSYSRDYIEAKKPKLLTYNQQQRDQINHSALKNRENIRRVRGRIKVIQTVIEAFLRESVIYIPNKDFSKLSSIIDHCENVVSLATETLNNHQYPNKDQFKDITKWIDALVSSVSSTPPILEPNPSEIGTSIDDYY
jgi:uncharacterized protein (DUF342 family)